MGEEKVLLVSLFIGRATDGLWLARMLPGGAIPARGREQALLPLLSVTEPAEACTGQKRLLIKFFSHNVIFCIACVILSCM